MSDCSGTCPPPPYQSQICPAPPYNSIQNPNFATYAQTNPNFPLNSGSNHSQIVSSNTNNSYFNYINTKNAQIKNSGSTQPFVLFKTDRERIMYLQAQMTAQTRQKAMVAGTEVLNPPQFPAPTPCQVCNNVFSIINGGPICTDS
jgi:hypothetical protein